MKNKTIIQKIKKIIPLLAVILLSFAAVATYNTNRPIASTFINRQSRAILADDLRNACKNACPTDSQALFAKHDQKRPSTVGFYSQQPPSSLFVSNSTTTVMYALGIVYAAFVFSSKTRRHKLYCLWRD